MQQYTIQPLAVGINETDQGVMTYLRDYGRRILLPIYVFCIRGAYDSIQKVRQMADVLIPLHDIGVGRNGVV